MAGTAVHGSPRTRLCDDRVVRSHLGTLDVATSLSLETPGPRHREGLGRGGRSEPADRWGFLFYWLGKVHPGPGEGRGVGSRCGKGMVFASTESHHWWEKKVANCQASPVLPGAQPKHLQTAFPASSRWEAARFASWLRSPAAGGLKNLNNCLENH